MDYIGFDVILIWYAGIGFFLWTVAQIIRAGETNGVFNNIACLLLFVIAWPKIMWTLCCLIVKRLFDVDHQLLSESRGVKRGGGTELATLRGRSLITEDGEAIEGEALDDVSVIGVVTFTICDVRGDNTVV
ncbi:TPA: hypothetical protein ACWSGR_003752 [Escherichia coli]